MKIGHLTFGTPEYVRVTKLAERDAFEKDATEAWDKWDSMVEDSPTISEKDTLYKILEDIERLNY
ncbi:hypothetical protein [Bacillus altitudinis]|uniref:hypothetical protein n=1 Tax=Bacillus altitudinis TaxID=293387 RepID=UPI00228040E6|nr:hypothetical protein [Bacillus altitudinis]MCY7439385.1 hypothetical protein [Bacillus altitudinis]MEC1142423.1 hypothetical protein [Bacillus altitudinis]